MKPWSSLVLVVGNLVLWSFLLLSQRDSGQFDFVAFETAARRAMAQAPLQNSPFEPGPLIPDQHLHLHNRDGKDRLLSVYAGYYPRVGLLHEPPHDPVVCYQVQGWDIKRQPVPERIGRWDVKRMEIERSDGLVLTVYSGVLAGDGSGSRQPGSLERLESGRSDVAFLRVEFLGEDALTGDWRQKLEQVWHAAASSLGTASK